MTPFAAMQSRPHVVSPTPLWTMHLRGQARHVIGLLIFTASSMLCASGTVLVYANSASKGLHRNDGRDQAGPPKSPAKPNSGTEARMRGNNPDGTSTASSALASLSRPPVLLSPSVSQGVIHRFRGGTSTVDGERVPVMDGVV